MRRVLKFPLALSDATQCFVTRGYDIVAVHEQNGVPTVWIDCDTEWTPPTTLALRVVGTGHEVGPLWRHEGTVFIGAGVRHVFSVPAVAL